VAQNHEEILTFTSAKGLEPGHFLVRAYQKSLARYAFHPLPPWLRAYVDLLEYEGILMLIVMESL
jgi:hypothetical protein